MAREITKRRNGKLMACEPCRKRKVACDHGTPTCARCFRNGTPEECTYHAAPMTRLRSSISVSNGPIQLAPSPLSSVSSSSTRSPTSSTSGLLRHTEPQDSLFGRSGGGHFGETSFSAVFLEHAGSLDFDKDSTDQQPWNAYARPDAGRFQDLPSSASNHLQLGIDVLKLIPSRQYCHLVFTKHVQQMDGWIRQSAAKMLESLWSTFHDHLTIRSETKLTAMANLFFENGTRIIVEDDDPQKWLEGFSGNNFRWEGLGILFTYWAFGVSAALDDDPFITSQAAPLNTRERLLGCFIDAAYCCAKLCDEENANGLLCYLLYRHNVLDSTLHGDTKLSIWRQHADLVSVVIAQGLHRYTEKDPHVVTAASESKKRVGVAVYNIDKVIASLLGRPPLLSRRYCSTPLPLDLSDDVLLTGGVVLSQAISALDSNGWNTEGKIYSTTILRARVQFASICDHILEMALSQQEDNYVETAIQLKQKSLDIYYQLPPQLLFAEDAVNDPQTPGPTIFTQLLIRLEHLQSLFLLDRILLKHGNSDSHGLLDVCTEMLSLTLIFYKYKDKFSPLRADFEWLFVSFGVPASGILCLELLKPSKEASMNRAAIPRSKIVQSLSLLVAFFEQVKPSAPNADVCHRVKRVVNRVFHQALDYPTPQLQPTDPSNTNVTADFDQQFLDAAGQWDEYLDLGLLDTFSWID